MKNDRFKLFHHLAKGSTIGNVFPETYSLTKKVNLYAEKIAFLLQINFIIKFENSSK